MPKLKNKPPKMGVRKNNQTAYVSVRGHQIYLGKVGADAEKNYRLFLIQWANGEFTESPVVPQKNEKISLQKLFCEYLKYINSNKNVSQSDLNSIKIVIRRVLELFPDLLVENFRPIELDLFRKSMLQSGFNKKIRIPGKLPAKYELEHRQFSRKYINKSVNRIKTIFSWGIARCLVSPNVHYALKYLTPIAEGETEAIEHEPRGIVDPVDIQKTLDLCPECYADIIRILLLTAMRPSELFRMTVGDIQINNDIWIYTPKKHKTQRKNKQRIIPLGPKVQSILQKNIENKSPEDFVFSPKNGVRKNPKNHFSYSVGVAGRFITRLIRRANENGAEIKPWTLYQLRHTKISNVAMAEGEIAAQRIAGHSSLQTTEIYNHSALQETIQLAKKYG